MDDGSPSGGGHKSREKEQGPITVSVVIATYNRAHLIGQTIESILAQTRPPDEIIVVNDGSTDGTRAVVGRYGDKLRYIEKANGGKPTALNLALPEITSSHTWIFDDDDIALPRALEMHVEFLSAHPSCDFTYSPNYSFTGDTFPGESVCDPIKDWPPLSGREYFIWIMASAFLPTLMQGMLAPTACYRAVGGFNEALLRCEDHDMVLHLARRFRPGRINEPTFALREHGGARGPGFQEHAEADRYIVWRQQTYSLFGKVRESLALWEYLPEKSSAGELDPLERRRAILQRAAVMAIHGLFPEAADDFADYVRELDSATTGLTAKEDRQISTITHVPNKETMPPADYYLRLGAAARARSALLAPQVRGVYWSMVREIKQGRLILALQIAGRGACLIAGYLGMPSAQRDRLKENS